MNLVQIGLGSWGRDWARTVSARRDIRPIGWVDGNADALAALQDQNGAPPDLCYPTLEAASEALDSADAALITTSVGSHLALCRVALERGCHVLVEKPFGYDRAEAQALVDLAREKKLVLMVNQQFRFFPAVQVAAQLVRDKYFGEITGASISFRRHAPTEQHLRPAEYDCWEPLLADMSVHHFDLIRMVLGQTPVEVYSAKWQPPGSPYHDAAAASVIVRMDSGLVVNFSGNWVSSRKATGYAGEWVIECERGTIFFTSRGDRDLTTDGEAVWTQALGETRQPLSFDRHIPFGRAVTLARFVELCGGQDPIAVPTAEDNLQTLDLMFAAIESAATGQSVRITEHAERNWVSCSTKKQA